MNGRTRQRRWGKCISLLSVMTLLLASSVLTAAEQQEVRSMEREVRLAAK